MRLIGTLPTESDARRLCDYLLTQRIDAHAEEQASDGAWQIWIEHDDHLDAGRAELEQFKRSPNDPKYGSAATTAKKLRDAEEKEAARRRANFRDVRTNWAQNAMGRYATPVALSLIFMCVILGALMKFGSDRESPLYRGLLYDDNRRNIVAYEEEYVLLKRPKSMFNSLRRGELWRVATPMFIHYGPFHLLFNMMWLWRLGQAIESRKGATFFLVMVLVISAISCSLQALWGYSEFGGMSGVVAGLFGYAWMKGKFQSYEGIGVTDQDVGLMIGWLVICSFGLVGSIANAAHWGGLAVGMAFGLAPYAWRRWVRKA